MEEYKSFFREYCDFLKKYRSSSDPTTHIMEYMDFMQRYSEYSEAFDAIDSREMTSAERKLYIDTTNEIEKMLLDAMNY